MREEFIAVLDQYAQGLITRTEKNLALLALVAADMKESNDADEKKYYEATGKYLSW